MIETGFLSKARLETLAALPSSDELRARLVMLQAAQASGDTVHGIQLMAAKRRVEEGAERDALQARRPGGCFCLGLGEVNGSSCPCPDGIALVAERHQRAEMRRVRDVAAYIARSGVPPRFQDFTFASHPKRGTAAGKRVEGWRPGREKSGLYLYGDYGSGKTGLAVAALRAYIEREAKGAWFYRFGATLEQARRSYDGDVANPLDEASRRGFIVLDDLGAERATEWVLERLYQLIDHRHGHLLPTVITSNFTLDELAERVGARVAWRIAEMCEPVGIDGRNLREIG